DVSLATVIKEIKRQSGYNFLYDAQALSSVPVVSIDVAGVSVSEALDKCFENLPLNYVIKDNNVIISKKEKSETGRSTVQVVGEGQQRGVSGQVTDEYGEPLAGTTITVKGTTVATTTDNDGNYQVV